MRVTVRICPALGEGDYQPPAPVTLDGEEVGQVERLFISDGWLQAELEVAPSVGERLLAGPLPGLSVG